MPKVDPEDIDTRSLAKVVRAILHPSPRGTDHAIIGDEDVVEEHLVEHGVAGDLAQRPNVEPRTSSCRR